MLKIEVTIHYMTTGKNKFVQCCEQCQISHYRQIFNECPYLSNYIRSVVKLHFKKLNIFNNEICHVSMIMFNIFTMIL